MVSEIKEIKTVHLEVSNDERKYTVHREMNTSDLKTFGYFSSTLEIICGLLDAGKLICQEAHYKTFRLRFFLTSHTILMYNSENIIESPEEDDSLIPASEQARFDVLSKREREILCFLYRGYRQGEIAFVFGMSVHTIKRHRANIYHKTGFNNKTDLAIWCEKYLHCMFQMDRSE